MLYFLGRRFVFWEKKHVSYCAEAPFPFIWHLQIEWFSAHWDVFKREASLLTPFKEITCPQKCLYL